MEKAERKECSVVQGTEVINPVLTQGRVRLTREGWEKHLLYNQAFVVGNRNFKKKYLMVSGVKHKVLFIEEDP